MWVSITFVSTLFTFCPPAPPLRAPTEVFRFVSVESFLVSEHFVELRGLGEKARLHPRQTVAHRKCALIQFGNRERRVGVCEHVTAIRREQQLEKVAGETASRLDDREETLRREIETTKHARHVQNDFSHEAVFAIRSERLIDR